MCSFAMCRMRHDLAAMPLPLLRSRTQDSSTTVPAVAVHLHGQTYLGIGEVDSSHQPLSIADRILDLGLWEPGGAQEPQKPAFQGTLGSGVLVTL